MTADDVERRTGSMGDPMRPTHHATDLRPGMSVQCGATWRDVSAIYAVRGGHRVDFADGATVRMGPGDRVVALDTDTAPPED